MGEWYEGGSLLHRTAFARAGLLVLVVMLGQGCSAMPFVLSHCNRERYEGGSLLDRTAFARAGGHWLARVSARTALLVIFLS